MGVGGRVEEGGGGGVSKRSKGVSRITWFFTERRTFP